MEQLLKPNEMVVSMSIFPRLGVNPFTEPETCPNSETSFSRSDYWPNPATYLGHPRFKTLTRNITMRRKEKVVYVILYCFAFK